MTEQTTPSIVEVQTARVERAADLKGRILAAIAVSETTVSAAIAARLMVGSYLLIKALSDSTLVYRKVNGDADARLPMMMQMMLSGTPAETLKVVSPRYLELVGPIADRLLDAAEARLAGEPVTGEEADIAILSDQRSLAYQLASVSDDLANSGDAETSSAILLAGWIAADVSDLANSADSHDSGASQEEFEMAAFNKGSYNPDADELRTEIKSLSVEVLIAQVMTPYHNCIVPLISELAAIVDTLIPDSLKQSVRKSDAKFVSIDSPEFDAAIEAQLEKELANDEELAAALAAGIPLLEPAPRATDQVAAGSPEADDSKKS